MILLELGFPAQIPVRGHSAADLCGHLARVNVSAAGLRISHFYTLFLFFATLSFLLAGYSTAFYVYSTFIFTAACVYNIYV